MESPLYKAAWVDQNQRSGIPSHTGHAPAVAGTRREAAGQVETIETLLTPTVAPVPVRPPEIASAVLSARRARHCIVAGAVIADAVALAFAFVIASRLRDVVVGTSHPEIPVEHLWAGGLSLPIWIAVFHRYRLYSPNTTASQMRELVQMAHAAAVSVVLMAAMTNVANIGVANRWLLIVLVTAMPIVLGERAVVRAALVRLREKGRLMQPVVVLGDNGEALALMRTLRRNRRFGYRLVGFVADIDGAVAADRHHEEAESIAARLGSIADTVEVVRRTGATAVVIATTAVDCLVINRLTRELTDLGIHVELSASLRDIAVQRLVVHPLGGLSMVHVMPVYRSGWRSAAKRCFDVAGAGSLILVLAPALAVVALSIKLSSPGGVIFRQERVGRGGRSFSVNKFRTMVFDAEDRLIDLTHCNELDGALFKMRDDPRVTRVGRVLRRWSIDELPQLWNVLRGDMSLVGPRPALPREMISWSPELYSRLRVKPGMTGMWQVNGRSNLTFEEYVRLDLYYVDNWSLLTDLAIVAKTVPTIVSSRGAY